MQIDAIKAAVPVSIECDGQIVINISFGEESEWAPNYWFPGDRKSTVKVGVDPGTGAVLKVVVVSLGELSSQRLLPDDLPENLPQGLPCAVPATWPGSPRFTGDQHRYLDDSDRYVSEERKVMASLVGDRLTLAFDEFNQPLVKSVRCDRVVFLIDQCNKLRGIEVRDLSESEVENIRYAGCRQTLYLEIEPNQPPRARPRTWAQRLAQAARSTIFSIFQVDDYARPKPTLDSRPPAAGKSTPSPSVRVCSFESRRAIEMRSLIERQGGIATVAPSMREVPIEENPAAFEFAQKLFAGRIDVVIFMTGVGARALLETVETRYDRDEFFKQLDRCTTIVRGPKPTTVLRQWNIHIDHRAPEPNTSRELLQTIDYYVPLGGKTVAVQEYGEPNEDFYRALENRGAVLVRVPVYRWAFPEDTGPLLAAIRATIAGEFDVLLFTSAHQLTNVLQAAKSEGLRDAWIAAARKCRIGSVGPTASEAIRDTGLQVDVEASPPKMGQLILQTLKGIGPRGSRDAF